MKVRYMIMILLSVSVFSNPITAYAGEMLVIVNKSVTEDALSQNEISDIYLGTKTKWSNGDKIYVGMLKKGPLHESFSQDVVKTTPIKLRTFWKKIVFTGTGTPPKIFKNEPDLVRFVANKPGAIGYITPSTSHDGVKEILLK